MTLNATTEVPCLQDFKSKRVARSLMQVVADEWLTENVREGVQANNTPGYSGGGSFLTLGNVQFGGGSACSDMSRATFASTSAAAYATSPDLLWYGGAYTAYVPGGSVSASGISEFPGDPPAFTDPLGPWL